MAQVILSSVGRAIGGPIGGFIGSTIGRAIDHSLISSLAPARQVGPRLDSLHIQSTGEGSPLPAVFGRARISGQVLWAARFTEARVAAETGGGKGGPKAYQYDYSLSFAVGLCEGPIDGIGRIWADGKPLDQTGVTMRVYLGADDQTPDPLIEAVEGEAPAYRGLAYVVFEDLPLAAFGNRPPQLSFEVFRRPKPAGAPPALEDLLTSVCLIPGAGEFVYATEPVLRRLSISRTAAENVNNLQGRPDLLVSLDQLQAHLPNLESVTLVVAWFGDDLRCGQCRIRPGVEAADKLTLPYQWRAGGVDRDGAHLISTIDGGPAYGGTPADRAVLQAIDDLKARGLKVTLYPFIMMDVPPGNGLDDPYGGSEQAAFPWRGRITCHPAAGQPGSPDKTAGAATQVDAFFGAADPDDFSEGDQAVDYAGDGDDWGFRRFILHHAHLAVMAGADAFLLGSEMVGLTTIRSGASAYPAVAALRDLAADCRAVLGPDVEMSYAADWSEYFGHQPTDGSGDVHFHLDPLWADGAIDFVGVDWYPPAADWRDGLAHLDALAGYAGPLSLDYLRSQCEGGEDYDWFYATGAARLSQTRTPITDGAYAEPWVFRAKDLKSWWSNAHHDRPGGVRSSSPTAWVPQSKPIRLVEFGCPAVDKGANSPNLFFDPKSAESGLPPFSNGARDDLAQRRLLESWLAHFADEMANPVSSVYGEPMVQGASAWCWDARPYPDFPGRSTVWSDAPNWRLGHWLNGRLGTGNLADLVRALAQRGGVDVEASDLDGAVTGYVVDRPMRLSDAIAPLSLTYAFDAAEQNSEITFVMRAGGADASIAADELAWPEDRDAPRVASRVLESPPRTLQVRFIDETTDYQTGAVTLDSEEPGRTGSAAADLPIVMDAGLATRAALRLLRLPVAEQDELTLYVSPLTALRIEPGDLVVVEGAGGPWRVLRSDADERPRLTLTRAEAPDADVPVTEDWRPTPPLTPPGPPVLLLLDLPPLPGSEADYRPLAAVAASPGRAEEVSAGASGYGLTVRARAAAPAAIGETLSALSPGPLHRLDQANSLTVRMEGGSLESASLAEILAGANACAVLGASGEWEVLQFTTAKLIGASTWRLSGLLRGQAGTDPAMAETPAGAAFVLLDGATARADVALSERGLPLMWKAAPAGAVPAGLSAAETAFTWAGLHFRPFAPAHLAARKRPGGDLEISWVRRARIGGDGWDDEPPLSEEAERYRLEILDGAGVVRTADTATAAFTYTAAMQTADFGGPAPGPLNLRVRQWSATYGWGVAAERMAVW